MKTRNYILIVGLIFILLLTVLREVGVIELNRYKYQYSTQSENKWENQKQIQTFGESNEQMSPVPFVLRYKSKKLGDINNADAVMIDIENVDFGQIWTPFFKSSNFKVFANCNDTFVYKPTKLATGKVLIKGKLIITGHIKIVGFCSYRKAKSLIIDQVMAEMYNNAKENIK